MILKKNNLYLMNKYRNLLKKRVNHKKNKMKLKVKVRNQANNKLQA